MDARAGAVVCDMAVGESQSAGLPVSSIKIGLYIDCIPVLPTCLYGISSTGVDTAHCIVVSGLLNAGPCSGSGGSV